MRKIVFLALVFGVLVPAVAQDTARLLRFPAIHEDRIVFTYAGNLYTVAAAGGVARRLTNDVGFEMFARFSPDGKWIAFTAQYDGNTEVYLMPADGGEPKRLTFTATLGRDDVSDRMGPNNIVMGWKGKSDRIVFRSRRTSFNSFQGGLYLVSPAGELPEELPLPRGGFCSFSPDDSRLAYNRIFREFRTWKRYRGGMADDIWIYNFKTKKTENITRHEAQDIIPMWHENTIYFLSDRGERKRMNLYAYDTQNRQTRRLTDFTEFDIKFPSLGKKAIVFENGGEIYRFDLADQTCRKVAITIREDGDLGRSGFQTVSDETTNFEIAPDGNRALFGARGDVFTVPAKHGAIRNLTQTPGVHERDSKWSPDGQWIAYISDASGEDEIYIRPQDGSGAARQITRGGQTYKYGFLWSPDSQKILWSDKRLRLRYVEIHSGAITEVDQAEAWEFRQFDWSPDSRWIVYARPEVDTLATIQLYSLERQESFPLTRGWYEASSPTFSSDGKFVFFVSNRDFKPLYSWTEWNHVYQDMARIYLITLAKQVESPFRPLSDEVEIKKPDKAPDELTPPAPDAAAPSPAKVKNKDKDTAPAAQKPKPKKQKTPRPQGDQTPEKDTVKAKDKAKDKPKEKVKKKTPDPAAKKKPAKAPKEDAAKKKVNKKKDAAAPAESGEKEESPTVTVDRDGIQDRLECLPIEPSRYFHLVSVGDALYYLRNGSQDGRNRLLCYDLKEKKETDLGEIDGYEVSADGKKMLVKTGRSFGIIDQPKGHVEVKERLDLSEMKVWLDRRQEWAQIFQECWRQMREFFYVSNMHGVDWPAMRQRYAPLVESVNHRADLTYVIGEMIGELNVGHTYVGGGDYPKPPRVATGLLGARLSRDVASGYYRIEKILRGQNWVSARKSPLTAIGVDVSEGDYILAVDGRSVAEVANIYQLLLDKAGAQVTLTINERPEEAGSREVVVLPIDDEAPLYYYQWVQGNIETVSRATDGKVGYLHIPDMSPEGLNEFVEHFYPQIRKKALIVDVRGNGGGNVSPMIIERLRREIAMIDIARNAAPSPDPEAMIYGPLVCLADEYSASDGDLFTYRFKQHRLGKVVGKRTWGGVVGIRDTLPLLDGGYLRKPEFSRYDVKGKEWIIEGYGVEPDIVVDNDPAQEYAGVDQQLNRAIEVILAELKRQEKEVPPPPPPSER